MIELRTLVLLAIGAWAYVAITGRMASEVWYFSWMIVLAVGVTKLLPKWPHRDPNDHPPQ